MLLAPPFGRSKLVLHTKVRFPFSVSWVKQRLILNDFYIYYKNEVSSRHYLTHLPKLTWIMCLFVATFLIIYWAHVIYCILLTSHIHYPQSCGLSDLGWLTYYEHAFQPLLNMFIFINIYIFIFEATPNHISLKQRCLIQTSNQMKHIHSR